MFYAFVGLVIVSLTLGHMYTEHIGWLTLGLGIMVLAAINGMFDYLHDRRYDDPDA
jgi:ABC-type uncharacterized transport system permease subunit